MEVHNTGDSSTRGYSHLTETKKMACKISNQLIGPILRDALFMPLHGKKVFPESTLQSCKDLYNAEKDTQSPKMRRKILENFEITTKHVVITVADKSYRISYSLYESKNTDGTEHLAVRIGGRDETLHTSTVRIYPLLKAYLNENTKRSLSLCQFSFYEVEVQDKACENWAQWKPNEAIELGSMFFEFLHAFSTIRKKPVDSLICHSLGSVIFEGLQEKSYESLLPKVVILDRALPSVWKVGRKLYGCWAAYALYAGAYVSGWSSDPEARLLSFFQQPRTEENALAERKVILLEVKEDEYFSGLGAFSSTFCQEISKAGAVALRVIFDPNHMTYHPRSHHALPLNKLLGDASQTDNNAFPLDIGESAAMGIVRHVFLKD